MFTGLGGCLVCFWLTWLQPAVQCQCRVGFCHNATFWHQSGRALQGYNDSHYKAYLCSASHGDVQGQVVWAADEGVIAVLESPTLEVPVPEDSDSNELQPLVNSLRSHLCTNTRKG
jgi:hypothetical protein